MNQLPQQTSKRPQQNKSQKLMQTSTCRDETLKNQPNKMGMPPQYFYTIPTSCAIKNKIKNKKKTAEKQAKLNEDCNMTAGLEAKLLLAVGA